MRNGHEGSYGWMDATLLLWAAFCCAACLVFAAVAPPEEPPADPSATPATTSPGRGDDRDVSMLLRPTRAVELPGDPGRLDRYEDFRLRLMRDSRRSPHAPRGCTACHREIAARGRGRA